MNYELALKLKEAGFPIKTLYETDPAIQTEIYIEHVFPTLSELIEACGDNLIAIQRHEDNWSQGCEVIYKGWDAVQEWVSYYPPEVEKGAFGDTPEEAVANLWLELNKK